MASHESLRLQHDAAQMRALLESEPWACYLRHLDAEVEAALARILDSPLEGVEVHRGAYRALRLARSLPERVIEQARRRD